MVPGTCRNWLLEFDPESCAELNAGCVDLDPFAQISTAARVADEAADAESGVQRVPEVDTDLDADEGLADPFNSRRDVRRRGVCGLGDGGAGDDIRVDMPDRRSDKANCINHIRDWIATHDEGGESILGELHVRDRPGDNSERIEVDGVGDGGGVVRVVLLGSDVVVQAGANITLQSESPHHVEEEPAGDIS